MLSSKFHQLIETFNQICSDYLPVIIAIQIYSAHNCICFVGRTNIADYFIFS